ncbi:MAG TPA: hypothetical protein ENK05_02770 [Gammaproteobacteria bacterium]|nr:hypothetical protein [Gammaproteobacteria bacterium]
MNVKRSLQMLVLVAWSLLLPPAYAYQPFGYQPPARYPQQYPYPGMRGPTQGQSYWAPYQQRQPQYQPPRVETYVSASTPYEQQSLVYRIRIIGTGNLKTVTPELPETDSVVLRQLGEPVVSSDSSGGEAETITEFRYLLMPLTAGVVTIPAARVTGTYLAPGGGEGPFFEVSARDPVILKVRPATPAVQPWLPLYDLQIDARIRGGERPAAGNPVTLEVESRAVGATGAQIPSVADQLKGDDFQIYPGKTVTEGSISADGRTLVGRRLETFTLVPQYGGWLKIPDVKINWWNVQYNRPEVAALLMDQLHVSGPPNPRRGIGGATGSGPLGSFFYWTPLVLAVVVLLYSWASAFLGDGRLPGFVALARMIRPVLGELYAPLAAFAGRLSPRRYFHRSRAWIGSRLPVSWKLWFCLRAVAREEDPADWVQALQFLAAKHLGVRPQANLRELGRSISACHPRADAGRVEALMAELDRAVYGGQPMSSFARWKREFEEQIKPGLFPIRFRQCKLSGRARSRRLPDLNPV